MKHASLLVILILSTLGLAGCASHKATIRTEPPGAILSIRDKKYLTPAIIPLERGLVNEVRIEMPGYESKNLVLNGNLKMPPMKITLVPAHAAVPEPPAAPPVVALPPAPVTQAVPAAQPVQPAQENKE